MNFSFEKKVFDHSGTFVFSHDIRIRVSSSQSICHIASRLLLDVDKSTAAWFAALIQVLSNKVGVCGSIIHFDTVDCVVILGVAAFILSALNLRKIWNAAGETPSERKMLLPRRVVVLRMSVF